MYKYILTALLIAFFAGCSKPKPVVAPAWYTTPPKDFKFIYATGKDKNAKKAKQKAILALRAQILSQVNDAFKTKQTKLRIGSKQELNLLLKSNEYICNTISMREAKLEKETIFKGNSLVLMKISREKMFNMLSKKLNKKFPADVQRFNASKNKIAIKRFITYKELSLNYPEFASLIQLKKVILPTYDTYDEFTYLNDLKNEYLKVKQSITIFVLSDINSRIFVPAVKSALVAQGLILTPKVKSKDALKIFITSQTADANDYSFKQSTSLVKYTTYDIQKKRVGFRQHTFIGKSRKSYQDAKAQAAIFEASKIRKLGIFDFLGLK